MYGDCGLGQGEKMGRFMEEQPQGGFPERHRFPERKKNRLSQARFGQLATGQLVKSFAQHKSLFTSKLQSVIGTI